MKLLREGSSFLLFLSYLGMILKEFWNPVKAYSLCDEL